MPREVALSLELLKTFVSLIENQGDAGVTAVQLGINQPSMSKRLQYLKERSPVLKRGPWLYREGKTWNLTEEGQRALPAVEDLIRRYEQLIHSVAEPELDSPHLTFACGRHAAPSFVRAALKKFRARHPKARVRMATLRGEARIDGVANGSLDLATVSYDEGLIHKIARRELHVETIASDSMGLICSKTARWAKDITKLAKTKADPRALAEFPLILPEPDAGIRKMLDGVLLQLGLAGRINPVIEAGGWGTILFFVRDNFGVGLVSASAVQSGHDAVHTSRGLICRYFDHKIIPASDTKLICRYKMGTRDRDLSRYGETMYEAIKAEAAAGRRKRP